ncbi:MAG: gamma-glutamylcyclotransferase [Actinobacteria bacterium]|nr:gamma-glutamylcyclotransferase [Actinomycetota bacterium]
MSALGTLFAYGTLLPGDVRWHFLQRFVTDEGLVDRADGRLFDTGEGYPAAVFGAGIPASVIHGRVFTLLAELVDEALATLDDVEGAVAGDYRRVEIVTHEGRSAWAYAYGGGLTLAPIEGGSWAAHRAGRA